MERVKRSLTLTLLIFANMFLLAHSVLPHAHYDGLVCFSLENLEHHRHCSEVHDGVCDCCKQHDETRHHHHGSADNCDLKEIVLRQQDDIHEEILPCENCLSLLYSSYTLNEFYLVTPEYGLWLEQKPYINNYIPPIVNSVKSLRAPPVSYFLG